MILVTGPTGSGKTTTLYGALSELNKASNKIITAEDPVEYRLPRINQVQVNHKIGLDFASILRTTLRQDLILSWWVRCVTVKPLRSASRCIDGSLGIVNVAYQRRRFKYHSSH